MSSAAQDLLEKRNNPDYLHFLAVGAALNVLCDGIRHFAEKGMKRFHSVMLSKLGGVQCHCPCTLGVRPSPHCSTKTCLWAINLGTFHLNPRKNNIPWHQSDSSKWHDPVNGYWEIAKIFMSDLGRNVGNVRDPSSTDLTGLLNLLIFCTHFNVQQHLLESIRDWRNTLAHSPNLLLSEPDKQAAFKAIINLINDVELSSCKEVQECRTSIERYRDADISILEEHELRVLHELRMLQEIQLKNKSFEMESQSESINVDETMDDDRLSRLTCQAMKFSFILLSTILGLFHIFPRSSSWFLVILLMVSHSGDKSAMRLDIGCSRTAKKSSISRFHFQEFNFTSTLIDKGENFFGRKWLFGELEDTFESAGGPAGVVVTGEPGSGKSALMSRLICSPFSSLSIYDNIIGYHLCDYAEKGKRSGGRFVRNLVDQIAGSIPEYSDRVANDELIVRQLENRCENYPVECFSTTVMEPLRELRSEPDGIRYIVLDALDECLEKDGKTSTILDILSSKISYFPKWLKLILSSRNGTVVTTRIPRNLQRMPLDPADKRNIEDIRSYIKHILSKNLRFMDRLLEAMRSKSTTEGINSLIDDLSERGEGNFLVVKTTLQYMKESDNTINPESFPTSLFDTYDTFFKRHFLEKDFRRFRALFEVLLAAGSPLDVNELTTILKLQNHTQEIPELVEEVTSFLHFGEDGAVRIYHQSLAEWLVNQANRQGGFPISKSRGHQYMADFLFRRIRDRSVNLTLQELSELSLHVLLGGMKESHKEALERLNVSEIRDPRSGRCILHNFATRSSVIPILELFLQKYTFVDILDAERRTPAFYAASEGRDGNLKLFIDKGSDVNYVFESLSSMDPIEILVQNRGMAHSSMIHVAAFEGHARIVELLIKSSVLYPKSSRNKPTPVQLASANGHLEVVKLLYKYESKADLLISLHHAAARNHSAVVEFLLKTAGVRDKCLLCIPKNLSHFVENGTVKEFHLSFCETALHAAVSKGHLQVAQLLLNFGSAALECRHRSGKTVLMDAVERNDTDMVELLLEEEADVETKCGTEVSSELNERMCDILSLYKDGFLYTVYCENDAGCACGDRAIHLSARYGLSKMAEMLLHEGNADLFSKNCDDHSAPIVAIRFDQDIFISHILPNIKSEVVVQLAARCGSFKVLKLLKVNPNIFALENKGITPLVQAVFWSPYPRNPAFHSCSQVLEGDSFSLLNKVSEESRKRIATVKLLAKSQKSTSSFVNKIVNEGKTALHYAAQSGFTDGVKFLVELGSNDNVIDRNGNTPLALALGMSPMIPDISINCYTTNDRVFKTCSTTDYDATTSYLITLQRSNIKICDSESAKLLWTVIIKRMPLSLYSLIKIGVDKNCNVKQALPPFLNHLNTGGKEISEVFKIIEIDVSVECGVPLRHSELHLMAYTSVEDNFGNFFKPSVNKRPFPLQRLIRDHPKGVHIFDECRDEEGYLAIHRAAQGGNFDAIEWFVSLGVDTLQRTWSGLTALDLSILYLETGRTSKTIYSLVSKSMPLSTHMNRSPTFEKLLAEFFMPNKHCWSTFQCDSTFEGLSPLHIAAIRGVQMLRYVYKKAHNIAPRLPFNCTNKHLINPLYLAYFYESIGNIRLTNMNEQLQNAHSDTDQYSFLQYPDREAEYHIIYNYFYHSPEEINNIIGYDALLKLENYDITECPGFYDLLPKQETVDETPEDDGSSTVETDIISLVQTLHCFPHESSIKSLDIYRPREHDACLYPQRLMIEKYAEEHYCPFIMRQLQRWFTSRPRKNRRVSQFIAERMGWKDISADGDVRHRWPFYFLYKKLRNEYRHYKYLETLNEGLEIYDSRFRDDGTA